MKKFSCSQCSYSTNYQHDLKRHSKAKHLIVKKKKDVFMDPNKGIKTPITQHHQHVQLQEKPLGHAMENLELYYKVQNAKLNEALQCQQQKHNQDLRNQQFVLQKQHNIEKENLAKQHSLEKENLQKHHNIEKENLYKEYQHFIDQNGIQYQKALENGIVKVCKEYQSCLDQYAAKCQQAFECQQHEHNKMKNMRDDLQDCIDDYLEAENKTKGKYSCDVCGARMKTYLMLLFHMKKHR